MQFFRPYMGEKYSEGICGKKVLVVDASFYCNHREYYCFRQCTNPCIKDSSSFNTDCPICKAYNFKLCDEPTRSIAEASGTYKRFAKFMGKYVESTDYKEIWSYMAFTSYVQFFLPEGTHHSRDTRMSDLSDRDFEAFNETLKELEPDIVIVWGCTFSYRIKEGNADIVDRGMLEKTQWYVCQIRPLDMDKTVTIINPHHPCSSAWFFEMHNFDKYFSDLIND